MTLPTSSSSSPTIKIPLNDRDPNENTLTFRRLLESNKTLRCRSNVKKRSLPHSKQQSKKNQHKPCQPPPPSSSSLLADTAESSPSSSSSSSPSSIIDLPTHFRHLEQQQKNSSKNKPTQTTTTATTHYKPNEPKLQLALNRKYNKYPGSELFIHIDTPIFTLPTESMWTIFTYCASFENFYQIACVCKKWRTLINAASLWKDLAIQWTHLLAVIRAQSTVPYYDYITTLYVTGATSNAMVGPNMLQKPNISFKHLRHMRMDGIHYTDIKFLMGCMRRLESVHCERIRCTAGQSVSLRVFADMPCLKSLELHFDPECHLASSPYDFEGSGALPSAKASTLLPSRLKTFSLKGIYDREETLLVERQQLMTMVMEVELVRKYSMLTSLTRLTSLTLGRISAFTSRVWLECLGPCAPRLEYLTLMQWPGAGRKDSPPLDTAALADSASERITTESSILEAAIAACFSNLTRVKEIYLDDFVCGMGVLDGISQWKTPYQIHIEGLDNPHYTIHDFKAIKVFGFKISMADTRGSGNSQ
ncbi:hypothetical protein MBANPS3_004759 [Mucor bainieri]